MQAQPEQDVPQTAQRFGGDKLGRKVDREAGFEVSKLLGDGIAIHALDDAVEGFYFVAGEHDFPFRPILAMLPLPDSGEQIQQHAFGD
ncbi:MAG: hypothetical protein JWM57_3929 [Phycisphaerales bacterium]|nr:hypothetical protein [Phycisphaerales bacterium]